MNTQKKGRIKDEWYVPFLLHSDTGGDAKSGGNGGEYGDHDV